MNRRKLLVIAILSLSGALLLAAGGLVAVTVKRPIYYVGTRGSGVVEPGTVPEQSLKDLALLYLSTFETYTPATVAQNDKALRAFVSPRHFDSFGKLLEARRDVVIQGAVTSVFIPDRESLRSERLEDGRYEVRMRGVRKTYLADELDRQAEVEYHLYFEVAAPTLTNPSGLYVVGQRFREVREEKSRE